MVFSLWLGCSLVQTAEKEPTTYYLVADFNNDWDFAIQEIGTEEALLLVDGQTVLGENSIGDVVVPANIAVDVITSYIDNNNCILTFEGAFSCQQDKCLTVNGDNGFRFQAIEQIEVPWFYHDEDAWKIEFAIRSAELSVAKTIYFPSGTYSLSNVVHAETGIDSIQQGAIILLANQERSGIHFLGEGEELTILQWEAVHGQVFSNWMFLLDGRQELIEDVSISQMTLDGNATYQDFIQGENLEINTDDNTLLLDNPPVELTNGMKIRLYTDGGQLPSLSDSSQGNDYFLMNQQGNQFQLSNSFYNPVAIDIIDQGSLVGATYQRYSSGIGAFGPAYEGLSNTLQLKNIRVTNVNIAEFGNSGIGIREGEWFVENILVQDNSRDSWGGVPNHHGIFASHNASLYVSNSAFYRNGYGFDLWGGNTEQNCSVNVSFVNSDLSENWFGGAKLGSAGGLGSITGSLKFEDVRFERNGTSGLSETFTASYIDIPIQCIDCTFAENESNGLNFSADAGGPGAPISLQGGQIRDNALNGMNATGTAISLSMDNVQVSGNGEYGLYLKTDGLLVNNVHVSHTGTENAMRLVGSGSCQLSNSSFTRDNSITIQPSAASQITAKFDDVDLGVFFRGDQPTSYYSLLNGSTWSTEPNPPGGEGTWSVDFN